MTKSQKAILLNTLVLPGAGHFVLKRPLLGTIYAGLSILCLGFILLKIVQFASTVSNKISDKLVSGEVTRFLGILGDSFGASNLERTGVAFFIYMVVWAYAIWDVYRIGRNIS